MSGEQTISVQLTRNELLDVRGALLTEANRWMRKAKRSRTDEKRNVSNRIAEDCLSLIKKFGGAL